MFTAKRILDIAAAEIGTRETPANSNRTKYGRWFGLDGYPWCMIFVQWCFHVAGASALLPTKTASCSVLMNKAKSAGMWVTSGYKIGDVPIYNFGTSKAPQYHTGILEAVAGGVYTAIEGNTTYGNDVNGGSVMRRNRYAKNIVGAVRPKYDEEKPVLLVAQEVLDGKWDNGATRREKLAAAGFDAAEVQRMVNALCKSGIKVQVAVNTSLSVREKPDVNSAKRGELKNAATVYVKKVQESLGASVWGFIGTGWISLDWVKVVA